MKSAKNFDIRRLLVLVGMLGVVGQGEQNGDSACTGQRKVHAEPPDQAMG
jgi:hypothetical protein